MATVTQYVLDVEKEKETRVALFMSELNRMDFVSDLDEITMAGGYVEFYEIARTMLDNEIGETDFQVVNHYSEEAFSSLLVSYAKTKYGKNMCEGVSLEKLLKTVVAKNKSYGNSFDKAVDQFGITAAILRIYDKVNRMETLLDGVENDVKDENIEDTMLDILGYLVLTLHYIQFKNA